ncbi:MAG: VTT domain-containing protein [Candidatus Pacebacteria bacterium]|nr:VTT domain-containing protein [Candidatus Paceibacterota bacterium]
MPIPGGLILIAVGAFAHEGYINIIFAFFAAAAGSVTSDVITFYVARHLGRHSAYKRYVENHKLMKRVEKYAQEYPKTTIFLSRFIGLVSTPVNAIMGLNQVRLSTFLSMDVLGNAICTTLYLAVGYLIGMSAARGNHDITIIGIALGILVLIYLGIFFIVRLIRD